MSEKLYGLNGLPSSKSHVINLEPKFNSIKSSSNQSSKCFKHGNKIISTQYLEGKQDLQDTKIEEYEPSTSTLTGANYNYESISEEEDLISDN